MGLQINNIAAKCDFKARALFIKVGGGVEAHYDGMQIELNGEINLDSQTFNLGNSNITNRWGFRIKSKKLFELILNLFKSRIESRIMDAVNSAVRKHAAETRNFDFNKIAGL